MYEYLEGNVAESGPTHIVIDVKGIAYYLHCSIGTASNVKGKTQFKLFTHLVVKEDDMRLYGFSDSAEREIFRLLISVSGIGPNTAMVMLSSLSPAEIKHAVENENANLIQTIKGIGNKTAQRIIIELKDKMLKTNIKTTSNMVSLNSNADEATSALQMLGFPKKRAEKILKQLFTDNPTLSSEEAVKKALKIL